MKIKFYLIRALTLPPHILAKKIIDKARQIFLKNFNRLRDWNRTTYPEKLIDGSLYRYLSDINAARLQQPLPSELREELSFRYLQHRFNLLGSGWVQVKYGMHCKGLDGFHYAMSDEVAVDQRGEWLDGRKWILNQAFAGRKKIGIRISFTPTSQASMSRCLGNYPECNIYLNLLGFMA